MPSKKETKQQNLETQLRLLEEFGESVLFGDSLEGCLDPAENGVLAIPVDEFAAAVSEDVLSDPRVRRVLKEHGILSTPLQLELL
jgi:hypothetical protein